MSDPDTIIRDAMRISRNNALDVAIELGEMIANDGGCIVCFIEQLKKLRREVRHDDRKSDASLTPRNLQ